MTSIGYEAFYGCSGLTSITVNAVVPPTLREQIIDSKELPVYVPVESVSAYKSAEYWKDLNIMGNNESGIDSIIGGNANTKARKVLNDGKLIIHKAGKTYDLQGVEMK